MYKLTFLSFLLLILAACGKSEDPDFNIIRFNLNNPKDLKAYDLWKRENQVVPNKIIKDTLKFTDGTVAGTLFYEDEDYKVFMNCHGEFGGSLIFQERKNKHILYYLESVCAVMIERRSNGYYIVESLAHMYGSGGVKFIKTPKSLVRMDLNPDWKSKKFPHLSGFEIAQKLRHQGNYLVRGYGFMCNILFEYKNKNYVIYSKDEKTLLGEIKADTLFTLDTLFHFSSYSNLDDYKYKTKNYRHYEFHRENTSIGTSRIDTDEAAGAIYVKDNKIICAYWTRQRTKIIPNK
jgi:hypothetical protein